MASIMRRRPAPRRAKAAPRDIKKQVRRKASPLKPGLSGMRNWAAGHMRAASYSRKGALRLAGAGTAFLGFIIFSGLALGGFLPDIRFAIDQFTENRLRGLGFEVAEVHVQGEGRIHEGEVRAALGIQAGDYLFDADLRQAQLRVQSLPWIKDAMVRRLWPDQYVVHIIERQPVALWQENGVVRVVDIEGRVIEAANAVDFDELPLLVGSGAAQHAPALHGQLSKHPHISIRIGAVVRVADRRWDLITKDGRTRILLPEHNPEAAMTRLTRLQNSHGLLDRDLEIIDLRVPDRLVIRPREHSSRPLYVKSKGRAA